MKLQQLITQYIALRKSLGGSYESSEEILRRFARAVGEGIGIREVTADQVNAFLNTQRPITRYWHRQYNALQVFYRYAMGRGHVESSPLPAVQPKPPQPFIPYIYTPDELRRLLAATTPYRSRRSERLEPHTFRTILLLLYGAGLRIGEALSLKLEDVDLEAALLTIRDTKFAKTRLVPVCPDLHQALVGYAKRRTDDGHSPEGGTPFFVGRKGTRLGRDMVERSFRQLCAYAGVCRTDGARYQPRLHDLRHTFAVKRLTEWYKAGKDVQRLLPRLSTYLGHFDISSTQLYLTMTTELLAEAGVRFAHYAMKEVGHD